METPVMMTPEPPPAQGKKRWLIPAIIAGVLACCICIAAIAVGIYLISTNQSANVVGTWQLDFDWGCSGDGQTGSFTFRADGTFVDGGNSTGSWTLTGNQIVISYDNGTRYTGTVSGSTISGEMVAFDGATGCWTAWRDTP